MNFDEIEQIMNSKMSTKYPKLVNLRKNGIYADILYDSFFGEMSAINEYIYEHFEMNYYDNFKNILMSIAKDEMKHLTLIGTLIKKLGRKTYLIDTSRKGMVRY